MAGRKLGGTLVAAWLAAGLLAAPAQAAELKPVTVAAFDRYVRASEERMRGGLKDGHFLYVDGLPEAERQEAYAELRRGGIWIIPLHAEENGVPISVPSGLVHDWLGAIFVPGATLAETLAVLQDYDHHSVIYKPAIRKSRLLEHDDNGYKIYLQLYRKSLVTVMINANFDVKSASLGPTRAMSASYSTRIAEVEDWGTPEEHELPVGNDHGYLWRLDNYWRVEQRDGGVYVQVESIALSRRVPALFAWLINPLIRSIPRAILSELLTATRKAVLQAKSPPGKPASPGRGPAETQMGMDRIRRLPGGRRNAARHHAAPNFRCISSSEIPRVSGNSHSTTKNWSTIITAKNTKG